jgi:hypothetical protein
MTTAAVAVGAAGGVRAWVASHQPGWLSGRRLQGLTVGLMALAVLAAGIGLG